MFWSLFTTTQNNRSNIFTSYQYQVAVIGSGSAGKEACLTAAKAGLQTLLVEERELGGTSFHQGSYAVRALRACANYFKRIERGPKIWHLTRFSRNELDRLVNCATPIEQPSFG